MADGELPPDPLSYVWYLLGEVSAAIGRTVDELRLGIGGVLQSVAESLNNVIATMGAALSHVMGSISSTIVDIVGGVLQGISDYLGPMLGALSEITTGLKDFFSNLLARLENVILGLWQEITKRVGEALSWISATARSVVDGVVALVSGALSNLGGAFDRFAVGVQGLFSQALDAIARIVGDITRTVAEGLTNTLGNVARVVASTEDAVKRAIQTIVSGSESLTDQIREKLNDVSSGFTDAADIVADALKGLAPPEFKEYLEKARDLVGGFRDALSPKATEDARRFFDALIEPTSFAIINREHAASYVRSLLPQDGILSTVLFIAFHTLLLPKLWAGVVDANSQVILREYSRQHPWRQLEAGDVLAGVRKQVVQVDEAIDTLKGQGFTDESARRMVLLAFSPPPPETVLHMWRRGLASEDRTKDALKAAGLSDEWTQAYMAASEYLTSPSDLITQSVREVFSPSDREKLQLDADFPSAFAERAAKWGMTEQTARDFWAAHWRLPSAEQGFEMLHRDIIKDDELAMLLKALDYSPAWRAKLQAISYNPYTRVDIRRMHKLGILKDGDLVRVHRDLGYNQEHAEALAEFVRQLNQAPEDRADEELGKLTKASILSLYRDGLLTREKAVSLLTDSGVSPEAANLYVQQVDVDEAQSERQAEAGLIVELALAGELTRDQARDRLNALGMSAPETEKILAQLYRKLSAKTKIPTRAEGAQMLEAGVISPSDYRALLGALGYPERWADAFMRLATIKAQKG